MADVNTLLSKSKAVDHKTLLVPEGDEVLKRSGIPCTARTAGMDGQSTDKTCCIWTL